MESLRSFGVARRELCVCAFCAEPVVDALPVASLFGGRRGRHIELGQCRAEVKASSAGDDRCSVGGEELVDRGMREPCVFGDRPFVRERPDPDEPRRSYGLRGEDRQAAIGLHRIGGNDLAAESLGDTLGHRRLARGGRPEHRDDDALRRRLRCRHQDA